VESGSLLKSSQLILESEILSTQQRLGDISGTLGGMTRQLSILTASAIDTSTALILSDSDQVSGEMNRPELRVFQAQQRLYDAESALIKADNKPVVYVFTQGYIGRPGFNFLNTKIRPYGIAGVGLNWKLNRTARPVGPAIHRFTEPENSCHTRCRFPAQSGKHTRSQTGGD
jgi:hypothetical protein